jgi:hypothetical protein
MVQCYSGTDIFISWRDDLDVHHVGRVLSIGPSLRKLKAARGARYSIEGTGSRILSPVERNSLAERHSVQPSYIIPALGDLVRRPEPLNETEVIKLSGEIVARIGVASEGEIVCARVAHDVCL